MIPSGSLKDARIWLSGSVPVDRSDAEKEDLQNLIRALAKAIFREGGAIIHGSHPTVWPILLEAAKAHQAAQGAKDSLTLAASKCFDGEYKDSLDLWLKNCVVHETPKIDDDRAKSLAELRHWMVERCDAVLVVGGNWWRENPLAAGVPVELGLALERGLPCFLLGGFGGAAEGYLNRFPQTLGTLRNGLTEQDNRTLALESDAGKVADLVVGQLGRLPLVRGTATGGRNFRILALDGGGIGGTFSVAALARWEELTKLRVVEHFDLIAGTSAGGIAALGLGMGKSAAEILEFYTEHGHQVFPPTSWPVSWFRGLTAPTFDQSGMKEQLEQAFSVAPHHVLRDSICRLVIPSVHARTGDAYVFRTNHHRDLTADSETSAVDVALATTAAPTYFRAAEVQGVSYVDGGVWANNPVLVAVTEALARLKEPLNHIDVLSVGTTAEPYSASETLTAGLAGWLWNRRIIDLFMHAQAQGTFQLAQALVGTARLFRVDETLVPGTIPLVDVRGIRALVDYGRKAAGQSEMEIRQHFLNGIPAQPWTRW